MLFEMGGGGGGGGGQVNLYVLNQQSLTRFSKETNIGQMDSRKNCAAVDFDKCI